MDNRPRGGTRNAAIEVVYKTSLPRELPNPVEERRKPRVEEATTEALPKRAAAAAAMGQWTGGPHKDKRRVVLDEGSLRVSRRERREAEETTPVARSTDTEVEAGRQSADTEERGVPVFEDMEEPTVEIAVWTTALDEALKKVTAESMTDEGELSTQVLDANRQKYKEMMSSLVLIDATEEEYRMAKGMGHPYRGMTRPF